MRLLIDGDVVAYRVTVATERAICWDDEGNLWTLHADLREAKTAWMDSIARIAQATGADKIGIAFSDTDNFRWDILPTYKANRKGKRKPTVYPRIVEWAKENYHCRVLPRLEADDTLGIWATTIGADRVTIATIDKDLKQIPCTYYNIESGKSEEITEESGRRFHLMQTLIGDATDGYGGCPGVGKVTAEKFLQEGTWEEVLTAFTKARLGPEAALQQAQVAKITEAGQWDGKAVTPWSP